MLHFLTDNIFIGFLFCSLSTMVSSRGHPSVTENLNTVHTDMHGQGSVGPISGVRACTSNLNYVMKSGRIRTCGRILMSPTFQRQGFDSLFFFGGEVEMLVDT